MKSPLLQSKSSEGTINMKTVEIKAKAIQNELGRRKNNKARKAKGESAVKPAAWYFASLTKAEFAVIAAGGDIQRNFPSGEYIFTLAS
jgi:hypothetical protein